MQLRQRKTGGRGERRRRHGRSILNTCKAPPNHRCSKNAPGEPHSKSSRANTHARQRRPVNNTELRQTVYELTAHSSFNQARQSRLRDRWVPRHQHHQHQASIPSVTPRPRAKGDAETSDPYEHSFDRHLMLRHDRIATLLPSYQHTRASAITASSHSPPTRFLEASSRQLFHVVIAIRGSRPASARPDPTSDRQPFSHPRSHLAKLPTPVWFPHFRAGRDGEGDVFCTRDSPAHL